MTKRQRAIRLTDETWACVLKAAQADGRSASQYVERLLLSLCGPTVVEDNPAVIPTRPTDTSHSRGIEPSVQPAVVVGGITLKGTRRNPDEYRRR